MGMKKIMAVITILVMCGLATKVGAQSQANKLLIVEFSTESLVSTSAEFVEIYNPSPIQLDLDGYKLEYKSATGTDWMSKVSLSGQIAPRGRYLICTSVSGLSCSASMSSGLATSGGHLRITYESNILDMVAWGTADSPEVLAAITDSDDASVKRLVDEDGYFIDQNNNFDDFFLSDTQTPAFDVAIAQVVTPTTSNPPIPQTNAQTSGTSPLKVSVKPTTIASYKPIVLSELFVDPKSPQTDKEDEYIEIYNPNATEVNLKGYKLESGGKDWRYDYVFDDQIIKPGEYMAVMTSESGLTLTNSGGKSRISDPNGKQLDGVIYEKAKSGYSLSKIGESWSWVSTPTPGAQNVGQTSSQNEGDGAANNSEVLGDDNQLSVAGSVENTSESADKENANAADQAGTKKILDTSVLVIVGGLALIYGLYEYRQNIRSAFSKLRGYLKSWRKDWRAVKWRRSN